MTAPNRDAASASAAERERRRVRAPAASRSRATREPRERARRGGAQRGAPPEVAAAEPLRARARPSTRVHALLPTTASAARERSDRDEHRARGAGADAAGAGARRAAGAPGARAPTADEATRRRPNVRGGPRRGELHGLGELRERSDEPDLERRGAEVERPPGEHGGAGAGAATSSAKTPSAAAARSEARTRLVGIRRPGRRRAEAGRRAGGRGPAQRRARKSPREERGRQADEGVHVAAARPSRARQAHLTREGRPVQVPRVGGRARSPRSRTAGARR